MADDAEQSQKGQAEARQRIATAQRTRATELDLSRLALTALPPEIGSLTALQRLDLESNQLTALPPEIGSLTALQRLDLESNQLTALPPEIGSLAALQTIDLNFNKLTALPPEIGSLTALQTIDLSFNKLTELPPAIGLLTALQTLDVRVNRLAALPPPIGSLTALKRLFLTGNRLVALPPEIGSLNALQTLTLDNNRLAALPPEIGSLTTLQTLYLRCNRLAALPPEIGLLTALQTLLLHDNPLLGLPPEVLVATPNDAARGKANLKPPGEILAYYFTHRRAAREAGTEPLMEAKVLVLGEASVGKTCLIAALSENKKRHQVPEGGTSGIVRRFWPVRVKGNALASNVSRRGVETLRLNCWDFGGQEIYHSAHTLFLTERAIYLVVISKRDNERQNNTDQWLKIAASFGGPDAVVYVVVNKSDERVGHPPDEEALRRRHPQLRGFLYTSCDDLAGIPEAQGTIVEAALWLKGVRLPVAKSWLAVKKKLETMKEHTLSMADWARLCRQDVSAEDAQRELLYLCDRLGTVRYFPAGRGEADRANPPEICDTAILNPEWVTLGIYALLDDKALKNRGGLLNRQQMAEALKQRGYPPEQERIIEEVMRRFDLLYDSAEHGEQHRMLIPLMLPEPEPAFDWPKEGTLEFVYQYTVMPPGLAPAFMARVHRHLSTTPPPWRHGCVLEIKGCGVRVIADHQTAMVSISVVGPEPLRRDALDHVRSIFDALHATVRDLGEQELIPVPRHPNAPMLDYKHMRALEWKDIREYPASGERPGEIVVVNVLEALNGVRGKERRKQDDEQRPDRTARNNFFITGSNVEIMENKKTTFNINGDIYGQVGEALNNCTNVINQQATGKKKDLLEQLRRDVEALIEHLPAEKADEAPQVAENLEMLVKQATSDKPNRKWYSVSAEGLLETSKWTKDFAGNIFGTVGQLGKLIWPDFSPPKAD